MARTAGPHCYLRLSALQAAADRGVTWSVQHSAQLLAKLEGGGTHKAWGLAAEPDEHIGPTVQDVHAARVQQALQLRGQRLGSTSAGLKGKVLPPRPPSCASHQPHARHQFHLGRLLMLH